MVPFLSLVFLRRPPLFSPGEQYWRVARAPDRERKATNHVLTALAQLKVCAASGEFRSSRTIALCPSLSVYFPPSLPPSLASASHRSLGTWPGRVFSAQALVVRAQTPGWFSPQNQDTDAEYQQGRRSQSRRVLGDRQGTAAKTGHAFERVLPANFPGFGKTISNTHFSQL